MRGLFPGRVRIQASWAAWPLPGASIDVARLDVGAAQARVASS
jgi:hypothetical protein